MKKMKIDRFTAGLISMACAISLIQDFYGLEGYISHLREHWTSGWYTVPLALIVWGATMYKMERKGE